MLASSFCPPRVVSEETNEPDVKSSERLIVLMASALLKSAWRGGVAIDVAEKPLKTAAATSVRTNVEFFFLADLVKAKSVLGGGEAACLTTF